MLPELWGSSMWDSVHNIAAAYPVKPTKSQKKAYCLFYKSLGNVLPCKSCSVSYKLFMQNKPVHTYLKSKKRLLYWTYLMHNHVNKKLKKRITISWGTVYKRYTRLVYYKK